MNSGKAAISMALLLGGSIAVHGQALDTSRAPQVLKYEWKVGKVYTQKMQMDQTTTMSMGGQTVDQQMGMNVDLEMAVSAISDSKNKRIESEYKRIAMNMNSMGMEMKYDSDDPEASAGPLAAMGGMVGQKFDMIVDGDNRIVEVQGVEELVKAMGPDARSIEMGKQLADKKQLEQLMNTWIAQGLPSTPVKPGDTWPLDVTVDMAQMGAIHITGSYTLAGYQDVGGHDCAVIDMDAELTMEPAGDGDDPSSRGVEAASLQVQNGKSKSRMYWDNELNWMRRMDLTQSMLLSMTNPADGSAMSIPMDQKITTYVDVR